VDFSVTFKGLINSFCLFWKSVFWNKKKKLGSLFKPDVNLYGLEHVRCPQWCFWLLFDFVKILFFTSFLSLFSKVLVMDTTTAFVVQIQFCNNRLWSSRTWKIHLQMSRRTLLVFFCFEIWSGCIYLFIFLVMISFFVVLALGKAFF